MLQYNESACNPVLWRNRGAVECRRCDIQFRSAVSSRVPIMQTFDTFCNAGRRARSEKRRSVLNCRISPKPFVTIWYHDECCILKLGLLLLNLIIERVLGSSSTRVLRASGVALIESVHSDRVKCSSTSHGADCDAMRGALMLASAAALSSTSLLKAREIVDRFMASEEMVPALELAVDSLNWSEVPNALLPRFGERMLAERTARASVEAFATVCRDLQNPRVRFAFLDVCAGCGDLSLPLAHWIGSESSAADFVAVDLEPRALARLSERAKALGPRGKALTLRQDVALLSANLAAECNVVVGLRACGAVADLAIRLATKAGVPFAVSPCCLWKALIPRDSTSVTIGAGRPIDLDYPRSSWLASRLDDPRADYAALAAADDSPAARSSASLGGKRTLLYKRARRIIEHDRLIVAAEEANYCTRCFRFADSDNPETTGLLVGAPERSVAALAIASLPVVTNCIAPDDNVNRK